MENFFWNIDTEVVDCTLHTQYTITGWFVSKVPGQVNVSVYNAKNNIEVPAKMKWVSREDVVNIYPFAKNCQGPGFQIIVEDIDLYLETEDSLKIEMCMLKQKVTLVEKTLAEIQEVYNKCRLAYSLDRISEDSDCLILEGWAYSRAGTVEFSVMDKKNAAVSCTVERISRLDINELYDKDLSEKLGFRIAVRSECLKYKDYFLTVQDSVGKAQMKVNVVKYKFSQSLPGRCWNLFRPSKLRTTVSEMKEQGFDAIRYEVEKGLHPGMTNYEIWLKRHLPDKKELRRQAMEVFDKQPKFSIVIPLYNTPLEYLKEIVDSVVEQTYYNWELCLADGSTKSEVGEYIRKNYESDARILYKKLTANRGISENTNEAIRMATGDFIMLSDHDDVITPNALYEMAKVINEHPETGIIYTDEDKVSMDGKHYFDPNFKPDFNFDYLRSTNYICHIFVVKKSIVEEVGMLLSEYDGAQDYDFILRCCEKTDAIYHIPKVLYHWRAHQNSTAGNPESKQYAIDAGQRALAEHYKRVGIDADIRYTDIFIMFQTIPKIIGNPKVSIVICTKDHVEDLDKCIQSIEQKSTWKNYEIIVVENNSELDETFSYYGDIQKQYENVKVVYWKDEFNYSAINNFGASYATGEYIILMNNDIEVITPEWMEYMLGYCQRKDVGMVGAKLLYPDDTVQHCGAVIGLGGFAGHILTRYDRNMPGTYGRLKAIHDVSAVTAACFMVKKSVFDEVNGLDESFKVALNDMDFCLRVRQAGHLIVINPWAELYHYESKSRGMEDNPEKLARFKGEIARFRTRWADFLEKGDPYYNPNLTLKYTDCSVKLGREKFDLID